MFGILHDGFPLMILTCSDQLLTFDLIEGGGGGIAPSVGLIPGATGRAITMSSRDLGSSAAPEVSAAWYRKIFKSICTLRVQHGSVLTTSAA